jgi:hypothetical protein
VSTNVNLTPNPSPKERGVAALKAVNYTFKIFIRNFRENTRYGLPSPLERGWG